MSAHRGGKADSDFVVVTASGTYAGAIFQPLGPRMIIPLAEFGGDNVRVGVAGDSAGGNLAAAVAIASRNAGINLAAQLLV